MICAYRSLFTFIDYKLLQKSLKAMQQMSFEIEADNDLAADQPQEVEYDILKYTDVFA